MKAAEWIDRLKAERGWESDYRVAKELGIHRATVSSYRTKTPTLDDETAFKVAEALAIEPHIIVMDQVAERTKVEGVRESITLAKTLLEKLTKPRKGGPRLGGGGVVDITSAASLAPGGDPAHSMHLQRTRDVNAVGPEYASYQPAAHALPQWLAPLLALIVPRRPFGVGGAS